MSDIYREFTEKTKTLIMSRLRKIIHVLPVDILRHILAPILGQLVDRRKKVWTGLVDSQTGSM